MKSLSDSLRPCQKEEEVKAEFCKFFKMKIFALRGIDHYTEHVLFEFKYDRNFKNAENVARVLDYLTQRRGEAEKTVLPKTIQPEKYQHFWQNCEKVSPPTMTRIRQKADRLYARSSFRKSTPSAFSIPAWNISNEMVGTS